MLTKEEKLRTERFFWQSLNRLSIQSGLVTHWERSGNMVGWKDFSLGIQRFHAQPNGYGFYGVIMEIGQVPGYRVQLIIENQGEVIFGVQLVENQEVYTQDDELVISDFMVSMANRLSGWDFDGLSFLAWKSPEIRFNFRNSTSRAVMDIYEQKDDSEALTRLLEEVTEIISQIKSMIVTHKELAYGTLID